MRLGIADGLELGAGLQPARLSVDAKVALLRLDDRISLQPGVLWLLPLDESEELSLVTFGLGLVFGPRPARPDRPGPRRERVP